MSDPPIVITMGDPSGVGAEVTVIGGRRYPLLAATRQGYRNLCRLLTRGKLRAAKGEARVAWSDLEPHAGPSLDRVGLPLRRAFAARQRLP